MIPRVREKWETEVEQPLVASVVARGAIGWASGSVWIMYNFKILASEGVRLDLFCSHLSVLPNDSNSCRNFSRRLSQVLVSSGGSWMSPASRALKVGMACGRAWGWGAGLTGVGSSF